MKISSHVNNSGRMVCDRLWSQSRTSAEAGERSLTLKALVTMGRAVYGQFLGSVDPQIGFQSPVPLLLLSNLWGGPNCQAQLSAE
jgi:hypothetical protein